MTQLIWITGAAGTGKTALSRALHAQWRDPLPLLRLDGDEWRQWLGAFGQGYEPPQRLAIGCALARTAAAISAQGVPVVASTISAFAEVGSILDSCAVPVLRVRLLASLSVLRTRRPELYGRSGDDPHIGSWPFRVDLELRTDEGSTPAVLAARVLAAR